MCLRGMNFIIKKIWIQDVTVAICYGRNVSLLTMEACFFLSKNGAEALNIS